MLNLEELMKMNNKEQTDYILSLSQEELEACSRDTLIKYREILNQSLQACEEEIKKAKEEYANALSKEEIARKNRIEAEQKASIATKKRIDAEQTFDALGKKWGDILKEFADVVLENDSTE